VVDGQLLDAHFSRPIYKHMLGVSVSYHDLEAVEPEYYQSLCLLLSSPLSTLGVEDSLTFSADTQVYGKNVVVDLTEGGQDLVVTDANKGEYVRLIAHHRMTAACKPQLEAFLTGFHSLVPLQVYIYIHVFVCVKIQIYTYLYVSSKYAPLPSKLLPTTLNPQIYSQFPYLIRWN
jgi:hypothetical protein